MSCLLAEPNEPERSIDPFERFRLETCIKLREATGWESVARFLTATEEPRRD